ncbi:mannose-6-phosphate isomerase, class I [Neobacillus sp. YIM B06451]|uniref:mannose-6-phosphate isomerase, class I n=1 Tax=Neobacillus sp. YIM B06451 TaxID=3070994 RepID=UPI00292E1BB1|nr:mannose-6-phosphate isomerase, class I [Neobacillus sp. YIM B06451]
MEPLFFEPDFKERIWGGERLRDFGYNPPYPQTGECWAFAAHSNGNSRVRNGELNGLSLNDLWEGNRGLFGNIECDRFPLLIKILDACDDLSVQVHPDDTYARENENGELGKTECWYIIDCEEGAEIIYGHQAKTKEELQLMVANREWDRLLRRIPVKCGDFFMVPSGTIHAIGKGIVILETQQNSDTTYRVYDYDRKDKDGNLRELHIERSLAVATVPSIDPKVEPLIQVKDGVTVTTYVQNEYFTVHKWEVDGQATLQQRKPFKLVSVLNGNGTLLKDKKEYSFKKGDHFLLPHGFDEFNLVGKAEMIVSHL